MSFNILKIYKRRIGNMLENRWQHGLLLLSFIRQMETLYEIRVLVRIWILSDMLPLRWKNETANLLGLGPSRYGMLIYGNFYHTIAVVSTDVALYEIKYIIMKMSNMCFRLKSTNLTVTVIV